MFCFIDQRQVGTRNTWLVVGFFFIANGTPLPRNEENCLLWNKFPEIYPPQSLKERSTVALNSHSD